MKRYLLAVAMLFSVLCSYAAGVIGKWNVKNLNQITTKDNAANEMGMFGILACADVVEFKSNGTFFANDSVYGKYSLKGDGLVLKRDEALVEAAKKKFIEEMGEGRDSLALEIDDFMEGYAEDSLVISFTKSGNTMLVECNQNMDLMKLMPFAPLYMLEKQGAAREGWNQGVTLSGKWSATVMGMMALGYEFKSDGVLEQSVSFLGMDKKSTGTYTTKNSVLTINVDKKEEALLYYMGKNCLYLVMSKDGNRVAVPFWKKK